MILRRNRSRSERGASAVEFVLVAPVLILMLMTVIQFVLLNHVEHVLSSAARSSLSEAIATGDAADAQAHGSSLLGSTSGLIDNTTISVVISGDDIVVTASAESYRTIPFVGTTVSVTYSGPVDRFVE